MKFLEGTSLKYSSNDATVAKSLLNHDYYSLEVQLSRATLEILTEYPLVLEGTMLFFESTLKKMFLDERCSVASTYAAQWPSRCSIMFRLSTSHSTTKIFHYVTNIAKLLKKTELLAESNQVT